MFLSHDGQHNHNPEPPKHLLTLDEAEERLKPHVTRLDNCIQAGWDAWNKDYAHKHHILRARARAAVVFDEIVASAEREFAEVGAVQFKRQSNVLAFHR